MALYHCCALAQSRHILYAPRAAHQHNQQTAVSLAPRPPRSTRPRPTVVVPVESAPVRAYTHPRMLRPEEESEQVRSLVRQVALPKEMAQAKAAPQSVWAQAPPRNELIVYATH